MSQLSPKFDDALHMKNLAYQKVQLIEKVSNQNVITIKKYIKISRVKWNKNRDDQQGMCWKDVSFS